MQSPQMLHGLAPQHPGMLPGYFPPAFFPGHPGEPLAPAVCRSTGSQNARLCSSTGCAKICCARRLRVLHVLHTSSVLARNQASQWVLGHVLLTLHSVPDPAHSDT